MSRAQAVWMVVFSQIQAHTGRIFRRVQRVDRLCKGRTGQRGM